MLPDIGSLDVLTACRAQLSRALPGAASLRWIDRESLHLTLRFLGATKIGQQRRIAAELPALARRLPPLATRGYALWPGRASVRLLVLELARDDSLLGLANACEQAARACGFDPDPRRFRGHVTLARMRTGPSRPAWPGLPPAPAFDRIALLRSTLTQRVAVYTPLALSPMGPPCGDAVR